MLCLFALTDILIMGAIANQRKRGGLAHRYALAFHRAMMDLSLQEQKKVIGDIEFLRAFFAGMPSGLFVKACLVKQFSLDILSELCDTLKAHEILKNLFQIVVENGRFKIVNEIFDEFVFVKSGKKSLDNVVVRISHAVPIDKKEYIEKIISAEFGDDAEIEFFYDQVDVSYGVTIQYNGKILDYSSNTQIRRLLNDLQV